MRNGNRITNRILWKGTLMVSVILSGCAGMKKFMGQDAVDTQRSTPIVNPFGEFGGAAGSGENKNVILRTKKGDRAIEIELPTSDQSLSEFVIPVSPAFEKGGRNPASETGIDETYNTRKPSYSDREITRTFPQGSPEDQGMRREVEEGLGVMAADDETPRGDSSYLAGMDKIKQLYRTARYEACLMEIDNLLKEYNTDPRLFQMRGTVLDRLGHPELAVKSWNQALRLDPSNQSLKRFIERKQGQARGVATP